MVSLEQDTTSPLLPAVNASAISLVTDMHSFLSSLQSRRRRLPTPTLSLNAIRPSLGPRSFSSEPSSYLSPPITTPSLMSPPPRHEAMDYMTSHGSKRKNHTRGASRFSPAGVTGQRVQSPAIEPSDIDIAGSAQSIKQPEEVRGTVSTTITKTLTLMDEPQEYLSLAPQAAVPPLYDRPQASDGLPDKASSIESSGSPAVTALRRLSEAGLKRQSTGSPHSLELSNSLGATIGWFKSSAEALSQPRKQSMGGEDTSRSNARRRSSAFRDGNRRRPEKDNAKAVAPGLKLPATITLRKATGLFNTDTNADAKSDAVSDESPTSRNDSSGSPTSCALIAFDSQQLDNPRQISTSHQDAQIRKQSVISMMGLELAVKVPVANGSTSVRSWQQAGAAPVVTVTDTYPSPAMLASPIKTTSFTDLPERRFSVVKIHSRKSVHRVIWCEDDGSCSSGSSSDPVSPTGKTSAGSVKSISPSENSPVRTLSASKFVSRQSFESTLHGEHSFPPNVLTESESNAPSSMSNLHPEGQMFQWLWGAELGSPGTTAEPSNTAERPPQSASKLGSVKEKPPAVASWLPQLMFPDNEEPTATSGEATMVRRGSFLIDSSLSASSGAGREIGSRRSISVQPLMLSRLGIQGAPNDEDGNTGSRRQNWVA
ncbi:MAG: hypothetical protein LQ341_006075 [Variospora aurantia]|nr:MAG: hypothetical protein LQ341_006075 [Variospora aurantia]